MNPTKKEILFHQLIWDYNISGSDIEAVFSGTKKHAGHYTRPMLFKKMLESYSWFTILEVFTKEEIEEMLTDNVVNSLRMPSLRKQYEFVQKRLQEIISIAG